MQRSSVALRNHNPSRPDIWQLAKVVLVGNAMEADQRRLCNPFGAPPGTGAVTMVSALEGGV